jgi:hypothetical protein
MTQTTRLHPAEFLQHLCADASPLLVRRGRLPEWDDQDLHTGVWEDDPELYALSAVAEDATIGQQARILFQLLRQSRATLPEPTLATIDRVVAVLVDRLPIDQTLTVFLALRRQRANHKYVTRTILNFLLNHPQLERLAHTRRATLVDLIEHALGRNTVRGIAKQLAAPCPDSGEVRVLLRWARDPRRATAVVRHLYRQEPLPTTPRTQGVLSQRQTTAAVREEFVAPKTVTATNRGDISATLVHLYRGGDSPELHQALRQYVERTAEGLPRFDGRLALVLDASASTRGYGEREFCCIAQSQALRLVLEKCCSDLRVHVVGGQGNPPRPEGATDLAGAVLDALADKADLVAVVTDGYENVRHGDLAQVVAGLPAAGCDVPVVFCQSQFTHKDDLKLRQPAPALPQLAFWHEVDFAPLIKQLFAWAGGERGRQYLRHVLRQRLEILEKERETWLCSN